MIKLNEIIIFSPGSFFRELYPFPTGRIYPSIIIMYAAYTLLMTEEWLPSIMLHEFPANPLLLSADDFTSEEVKSQIVFNVFVSKRILFFQFVPRLYVCWAGN